jgi:phage antirepressor YoqD-like protein
MISCIFNLPFCVHLVCKTVSSLPSERTILYSEHMGKSYTESDTIAIVRSDGREDTVLQTRWIDDFFVLSLHLLRPPVKQLR